MLDKLVWLPDRLQIGDVVLAVESFGTDHRDSTDLLVIHKNEQTVEQYEAFFRAFPDFRPSSVLELGLWDGGSLVFWNEVLHPAKIVGVDSAAREDKRYFRSYVESHHLENRLRAFWQTDQADKNRLRELVMTELDGHLDLVIDDCSHIYAATKASFEALFPLLSPGAWYIVEDWDWGHKEPSISRYIPWYHERSLTEFVVEIIKLVGSFPEAFSRVLIQPGFLAVQRGSYSFPHRVDLALEDHIFDKTTQEPLADDAHDATRAASQVLEERVFALESQLAQSSALLKELRGSHAWELIETLRRVRVKLAPPGSSREKLWFMALGVLRR